MAHFQDELAGLPPPAPFRWGVYTFDHAFTDGWALLKTRYGSVLAAILVYGLLAILEALLVAVVDRQLGWPVVQLTAQVFFDPVLLVGLELAVVRLGRGEKPGVGEIFDGFKRYWALVGANLLIILISLSIFVPMGMFMGIGAAMGGGIAIIILGVIAGAVAAIFVFSRLLFVRLLLVDPTGPRPGPLEAVRLSWNMTRSNWPSLFLLGLLLGLIILASAIMLVLPAIFFGIPFVAAVWAAAYNQTAAQAGLTSLRAMEYCPNCGYPTAGLETNVCPECGGPLTTAADETAL